MLQDFQHLFQDVCILSTQFCTRKNNLILEKLFRRTLWFERISDHPIGLSSVVYSGTQMQKAKTFVYLRGRGLSIVIINHTVIALRPISRMSCIDCHPALSLGSCSLTLCILTVITIQVSTNHHQLQHKPTVMVT